MENRTFGKKPQKARPKKKRGKNLTKTTEAEDDFVDRKTLIALDKTLIGKSMYIWGLTCQHADTRREISAHLGINLPTCSDDQCQRTNAPVAPTNKGETATRIPQRNLRFS